MVQQTITVAELRASLAQALRQCDRRKRAYEEAVEQRDQLIRALVHAGDTRVAVAQQTGLSTQRIDQIRRDSRL